jgi:hypothetical protein
MSNSSLHSASSPAVVVPELRCAPDVAEPSSRENAATAMAAAHGKRNDLMTATEELVESLSARVARLPAIRVPVADAYADPRSSITRTANNWAACITSLNAARVLMKEEPERRSANSAESTLRMLVACQPVGSKPSNQEAVAGAAAAAGVAVKPLAHKGSTGVMLCCCGKTWDSKALLIRHHGGKQHVCRNKPTCTFDVRNYTTKKKEARIDDDRVPAPASLLS